MREIKFRVWLNDIGMVKIKKLTIIKTHKLKEDANYLLIYPGWDKTLKHQSDQLGIAIIDLKINVIKAICRITTEETND